MTDHTFRMRKVIAPRYGGPEVVEVVDDTLRHPDAGQITIEVRAVGVNPMDYKIIAGARGRDESALPLSIGNEVAGVIAAIGDRASVVGGGELGDEVIAFRATGSYASMVTVDASNVFRKPASLDFPQAANLLLVGVTAADMLHTAAVPAGSTVLVHGASGAVGASLLQQAALQGLRVIGTASENHFDQVRRFGAEPVAYGDGLEERVRDLAPQGISAAFDCVGTDEAVDVSLAVVPTPRDVISIAAFARAADGIRVLAGADSQEYRDRIREHIVRLADDDKLTVPVAATFPLDDAAKALALLRDGHPAGKIALIP